MDGAIGKRLHEKPNELMRVWVKAVAGAREGEDRCY